MTTIKEITTTVRFTITADGHIANVNLPEHLPDMELSLLINFLNDLNKSITV